MERFIRSSSLVFFSNINHRTCNESIWKGFGTIASQNDAILEKALGSRFHHTPEGPGWEPPVCHLGDFSRVKLLQAFLTPYLQGNALLRPRILRQIYSVRKRTTSCSMKKNRSAINAQEIFNRAGRKHIHGCDSLKEKCTVQLLLTETKALRDKQIRTRLLSQGQTISIWIR